MIKIECNKIENMRDSIQNFYQEPKENVVFKLGNLEMNLRPGGDLKDES
jgi:hypothetical protein